MCYYRKEQVCGLKNVSDSFFCGNFDLRGSGFLSFKGTKYFLSNMAIICEAKYYVCAVLVESSYSTYPEVSCCFRFNQFFVKEFKKKEIVNRSTEIKWILREKKRR